MRQMSNPAFALLTDFTSGGPPDPTHEAMSTNAKELEEQRIAGALEEGFRRGFAVGRENAQEDNAVAIAELTANFDQQLASSRSVLADELASRLVEEIEVGICEISNWMQASIVAILEPWLMHELHQNAVTEFNRAIDRAIYDGCKIEISGSEELLQALAKRLEGRHVRIELAPRETSCIRAKIDEVLVEADFAAWIAQLREMAR
jgi:hypothetical protein